MSKKQAVPAILGLCLVGIIVLLWSLFGPAPRLQISKETTFVTSPLHDDGTPNYAAYLLERSKKGVTSENNAGVLLQQVIGIPSEHRELIEKEIGCDLSKKSESEPTIVTCLEKLYALIDSTETARYHETHGDLGSDEMLVVDDVALFDLMQSRAWSPKEHASKATLIREYSEAIDAIVKASERPRFYMPLPDAFSNQERSIVLQSLFSTAPRECVDVLLIRAMLLLGEGNLESAWQDVYSAMRLARLITQNTPLTHQLIGHLLDEKASKALLAILDSPELSIELAAKIQKDLSTLSPFELQHTIDQHERISFLDLAARRAKGKSVGNAKSNYKTRIDSNEVLRHGNEMFDYIVSLTTMSYPEYRNSMKADFNRFSDLHDREDEANMVAKCLSPSLRNRLTADELLKVCVPPVQAFLSSQVRANTRCDLSKVAMALHRFRKNNSAYPESLTELVPKYLPQVPVDRFANQPLNYEKKTAGYCLYSNGPNQEADGGTSLSGNPKDGEWVKKPETVTNMSFDVVIRLPLPNDFWPEPIVRTASDDPYETGYGPRKD